MQYEQSSVYDIDGISILKINEILDLAVLTVRSFIITQLDCSMNLNFGRRGGEKNTNNTKEKRNKSERRRVGECGSSAPKIICKMRNTEQQANS